MYVTLFIQWLFSITIEFVDILKNIKIYFYEKIDNGCIITVIIFTHQFHQLTVIEVNKTFTLFYHWFPIRSLCEPLFLHQLWQSYVITSCITVNSINLMECFALVLYYKTWRMITLSVKLLFDIREESVPRVITVMKIWKNHFCRVS